MLRQELRLFACTTFLTGLLVLAPLSLTASISTKQQEEEEPGATGEDEDAAASITPPTKNRSLGSGPDGDLDSTLDESLLDDEQVCGRCC